jgi:chlorophyllide a reductase subunit X
VFENLATNVAEAPPQRPTPLDQDGLLGLFKGDAVGRGVVLEPASFEDMCGGTIVTRPSLEVIYDAV